MISDVFPARSPDPSPAKKNWLTRGSLSKRFGVTLEAGAVKDFLEDVLGLKLAEEADLFVEHVFKRINQHVADGTEMPDTFNDVSDRVAQSFAVHSANRSSFRQSCEELKFIPIRSAPGSDPNSRRTYRCANECYSHNSELFMFCFKNGFVGSDRRLACVPDERLRSAIMMPKALIITWQIFLEEIGLKKTLEDEIEVLSHLFSHDAGFCNQIKLDRSDGCPQHSFLTFIMKSIQNPLEEPLKSTQKGPKHESCVEKQKRLNRGDTTLKQKIRSLPIFETNSAGLNRNFVPARVGQDEKRLLPGSFPVCDLYEFLISESGGFLKQLDEFDDLYELIGLQSASRASIYVKQIFPRLGEIHEKYGASKVKKIASDVKANYLEYKQEIEGLQMGHTRSTNRRGSISGCEPFEDTIKALNFVSVQGSGGLFTAAQCVCAESPLMERFMAHRLPAEPYNSAEWTVFLKEVGLQTEQSTTPAAFDAFIVRCAAVLDQYPEGALSAISTGAVSLQPQLPSDATVTFVVEAGALLVTALTRIASERGKDWTTIIGPKLKDLRFLPCDGRDSRPLEKPTNLALHDEQELVGGQMSILDRRFFSNKRRGDLMALHREQQVGKSTIPEVELESCLIEALELGVGTRIELYSTEANKQDKADKQLRCVLRNLCEVCTSRPPVAKGTADVCFFIYKWLDLQLHDAKSSKHMGTGWQEICGPAIKTSLAGKHVLIVYSTEEDEGKSENGEFCCAMNCFHSVEWDTIHDPSLLPQIICRLSCPRREDAPALHDEQELVGGQMSILGVGELPTQQYLLGCLHRQGSDELPLPIAADACNGGCAPRHCRRCLLSHRDHKAGQEASRTHGVPQDVRSIQVCIRHLWTCFSSIPPQGLNQDAALSAIGADISRQKELSYVPEETMLLSEEMTFQPLRDMALNVDVPALKTRVDFSKVPCLHEVGSPRHREFLLALIMQSVK
jgi:hypothetical protein